MQRTFLGHPIALFVLFFAEMWERFSYYGMRALLVLFMTKAFLYHDAQAYDVYGGYTSLVYATPVIGGLLADRILGSRRAIVLGGVLMALGHFAMAIPGIVSNPTIAHGSFYMALGLLICGNGFFKPNISSLVGKLYPAGDPRRDGAFTIFYMGINIGAFLAPLVCGTVGEKVSWHLGFTLAGIGMVLGLACFMLAPVLAPDVFAQEGLPPEDRPRPFGIDSQYVVPIAAFVIVPLFSWLVTQNGILGFVLLGLGVIVAIRIIGIGIVSTNEERGRIAVIVVLTLFSILFWAFFEQAGSSINLFTDRNVNRMIGGFEVPVTWFQAINPAFIIIGGPLFAAMWTYMARTGIEPSTPSKFALGLAQLALGFGVLVLGGWLAPADTAMAPMVFVALGYLLHTTGELCTSPVGLSMVTKLSPPRYVGFMMGVWFLSSSYAQYAASIIAKLTGSSEGQGQAVASAHAAAGSIAAQLAGFGDTVGQATTAAGTALGGIVGQANLPAQISLPLYLAVFEQIMLVGLVAALLCAVLVPVLKRGMHGIN
jgi:POT family proton-dependent oligopeptide transporter